MSFSSAVRALNLGRLLGSYFRPSRQARRACRRRSLRPCVKPLETRLQPAVHTWTGASSAVWSNAGNWTGGTPANDSQAALVFPSGAANLVNTNDLTGLSLSSVTLAGPGYDITGNGVQLVAGGSITSSNATGANEIDLAFALLGGATLDPATSSTTLTLGGPLSGSGDVTVSGNGPVIFSGDQANTYTGNTNVNSGTLELNKTGAGAVPGALNLVGTTVAPALVQDLADGQLSSSAAVTVGRHSTLDLNNHSEAIGPLTLTGGAVTTGLGTLTLTGDVTVSATPITASLSGNLDLGGIQRKFFVWLGTANPSVQLSATISDGEIMKKGNGSMTLSQGSVVLPYEIVNGTPNWGQSGVSMNNFYTFAVENGVLFAGGRAQQGTTAPTARILYSTDGQTWNPVSVPFATGDSEVRRLFAAPDGYLYAVTQGTAHIYRSLNGLTGWQLVATLDPSVSYGRWFTEFNGSIYLGTVTATGSGAFIYRSSDGVNWTVAYQFPSTIDRVQSLLVVGSQLYATTGEAGPGQAGGVFASADGTTWNKVNPAQWQGSSGGSGVLVHSLTSWGGQIWVGTQNTQLGCGVFSSTDGGATWTQVTPNGFGFGPAEQEAYRLFVWQGNLVVGTFNATDGGRLWLTPDGTHWYELSAPGGRLGSLYQGLFDCTVFNGNLCAAERCPNVRSAVPSQPFYITTLQTTVEIDAGTVINNGAIGGSVYQNGGTLSGTGTVGSI
jgi:autotransporter-associated beta strand protein